MKQFLLYFLILTSIHVMAQENVPQDFLSSEFHKSRRDAIRAKMPANSVAVFFANPVRNRANDVDYVYHQDPDFYYLTGYREPHAMLLIYSSNQTDDQGNIYNETLYVQEKNPLAEMWTGRRLGIKGAEDKLGFANVYNGSDFIANSIDFGEFDLVMHKPFMNDYRDNKRNTADLASLIKKFNSQVYNNDAMPIKNENLNIELNQTRAIDQNINVDTRSIRTYMAELRQVKLPAEMKLLKKAVRISAMGQIEVMKAMHPGMSETEIQGIHEYVFKKYGSEYEGYPSIVGAGHNGCVLHYVDNNKTKINDDLVLMDLGAEYHGYTADVTRTIPANGTFNKEQRAIYDIVYEAQEAGIDAAIVGASSHATHLAAKKVINKGLYKLGIIKSENVKHSYFPHGTSHHIGLDVHDANTRGNYTADMVITVEPGIYIPEGSPCDKKWWGIAVRIEDDILITNEGPINLSAEAPRKAEEIEAMMKLPSVFDKLELPNLD